MCIDFKELNTQTIKDYYPIPFADQILEELAGREIYLFMDCFSGYNQIMMEESDKEKTTFITAWGTFYYKVMPFRLKNAGVTY